MAGNPRDARPRTRGSHEQPVDGARVPRGSGRFPTVDPGVEHQGFDEGDQADEAAEGGRGARFVSWRDLERVADEAADIDSVVRSELQAIGERRAIDEEAFAEKIRPRRRGLPVGAVVAVLVAAAIVAGFLFVPNPGERPRVRPTSSIPPTTPAAPAVQPPSQSPPVVAPNAIVAQLSFSAPCWVEAVADGRRVFVGTLAGGSRTIRAKRTLLLTLGNAAGVDLLVNGRHVSTGAAGEVVHLSFALEGDKVTQLTS